MLRKSSRWVRGRLFWHTLLGLIAGLSFGSRVVQAQEVSQLRAHHLAGQTFLAWQEVNSPVMQDAISVVELRGIKKNLDADQKTRYRIYCSNQPIVSVAGLSPIAEVPPLTGWNTDYYGDYPTADNMALRYVIEEGEAPVLPGTGIYVHNPPTAGDAYYAVTLVVDEVENVLLTSGNTTSSPILESVGQGVPVRQRTEQPTSFQYVDNPTLHHYVRWEAPPNANLPNKPFDYLVAIPPNPLSPAPVGIHLHCWGGI